MFALCRLDAAGGARMYKHRAQAARAAQAPSLAAVSDMQRLSALSDAPLDATEIGLTPLNKATGEEGNLSELGRQPATPTNAVMSMEAGVSHQ